MSRKIILGTITLSQLQTHFFFASQLHTVSKVAKYAFSGSTLQNEDATTKKVQIVILTILNFCESRVTEQDNRQVEKEEEGCSWDVAETRTHRGKLRIGKGRLV